MEVRPLAAGEGSRFRQIRLRALQDAGFAFASSFDRERDDPVERWDELAAGSEAGEDDIVVVAVDAVCEWARDSGATRIEPSGTDRAQAAEHLYRKLGFTPTGVRRPLERDPSITEILLARPL